MSGRCVVNQKFRNEIMMLFQIFCVGEVVLKEDGMYVQQHTNLHLFTPKIETKGVVLLLNSNVDTSKVYFIVVDKINAFTLTCCHCRFQDMR